MAFFNMFFVSVFFVIGCLRFLTCVRCYVSWCLFGLVRCVVIDVPNVFHFYLCCLCSSFSRMFKTLVPSIIISWVGFAGCSFQTGIIDLFVDIKCAKTFISGCSCVCVENAFFSRCDQALSSLFLPAGFLQILHLIGNGIAFVTFWSICLSRW